MFRPIPEGLDYREHVLLKDGLGVLLRPVTPDDIERVASFTRRVSPEGLRMRFMASVAEVARRTLERLCSGDFTEHGGLLALVTEDVDERVVGIGNYDATGKTAVEVSFLVEDAYQGRGIGTILLERLAGLAAANGFVEIEGEVLPENMAMLRVFDQSGFKVHRVWGADAVHVELPVAGAAAQRERAELRERIAVASSLAPLLRPRVVAVVGASRDSTSIGNMIFRHLLAAGFAGTVYPVNAQASSVHGVRAYPSLSDLPGPIDLAVIAVPAEAVQEVAEAAMRAGARGLVVMTAGFAEAGAEGTERQRRLVELVHAHGARLVGPSCLGIMNTNPDVCLNASLAPDLPRRGRIGFFSHSAALGLAIIDHASERGIGFSTFVSAGNRADVSGNDLLQYWEEDADTGIALLYLETFGNPRRFARIARRMSARKPILCVKGARSRAGRRASEARSGLPGAPDAEVEALFQQTGVIRAETLEELFDVAVLLAHQPLPRGNRAAIITNSAGVATLLADAAEANGIDVAGPGLVDLGALTGPDRYREAVRGALSDEAVDFLFVAYACVGDCDPQAVTEAIGTGVNEAVLTTGVEKPVALCMMGVHGTVSAVSGENHRVFPTYRFPESAPRALAGVIRYADFRRQPPSRLAWFDDVDVTTACSAVQAALAGSASEESVVLSSDDSTRILACFGLGVGPAPDNAIVIRVRPDPLFGPILEVTAPGVAAVERITPLTDRDIGDVLAVFGARADQGLTEVVGRLSQLVEEIPWLLSMEAAVAGTRPPAVAVASMSVGRITSSQVSRP